MTDAAHNPTPAHRDNRPTGWMLAFVGMLLVSTDAPFIRWADTDARIMTGLVAAMSLPIYGLILWRRGLLGQGAALRRLALPFAAVAVALGLCQLSFVAAINHTHVANAVGIVAAGPVLAALGARVFLGERTGRRMWLAIALTVFGIGVIVWPSLGHPTLRGDLMALGAISCYIGATLIFRRHPDMGRVLALALAAAVTLLICSPGFVGASIGTHVWLAAAGMGLVFNTVGRICMASATRHAPSSDVALFFPVETVGATFWAWLFFSEVPSTATVTGAAIVIVGVLLGTVFNPEVRRAAPVRASHRGPVT
ncbi:MAG: DMT family transporter [Pseudomonadota bacterium]